MDNQTLYRSPVRLVSHAGEPIGEYSPQTISRTKKKLLAEASLYENEIQVNDIIYSKNDVIILLDSITDETAWRNHCTIYALPALLAFLEEGTFNEYELRSNLEASKNDPFFQFVSHPFAVAFNTASGKLIKMKPINEADDGNYQFGELTKLLYFQEVIQPLHQHAAFERIRIYFHELLYTLRNLSWEKFREDESVLHFVFSTKWMQFANKLPVAFASTRDAVVDQVTNLALRFQHKATWHYLHLLCEDLKTLECNQDLKHEVARLSTHFGNNANIEARNRTANHSSGSSPSVGRYILWGIWIFLGILRMGNSCSKSHNLDVHESYQYYQPTPSLLHELKDSEVIYADDTSGTVGSGTGVQPVPGNGKNGTYDTAAARTYLYLDSVAKANR